MSIPYDAVVGAFLSKITEYDFVRLLEGNRAAIVDGYMKRALSEFNRVCAYDLIASADSTLEVFDIDADDAESDEIINILSEGMVVQWLKPYVYQQELLQNVLNTRDFTQYSPAELLMRVGNAYKKAQQDFTQMIREYSYNHGDLRSLHI